MADGVRAAQQVRRGVPGVRQGSVGHGQVPGRAAARCPREEWPSTIRRLVSDQISLLLRRTIDPDRPLSEYGLDSLGNLELRTRIETETGVRISPTHITTVRGLAEHLCEQLESHGGCAGDLVMAGCEGLWG